MTDKPRYSTPAVEKAFAVLELVSKHAEGLRMVDVAEELTLPKTSTYVLLRSLEQLGYLASDDAGRYRLTLKIFELGMRAMTQVDLIAIARPHLDRLSERTALTVHLAALEQADVVYLAKVDGPGFVKFDTYVGKRTPAHLTAVGKAILSRLSKDDLAELMPRLNLRSGTNRATHTATALQRTLSSVRTSGYAVEDQEEVDGVRCVASPICRDGMVIASVGVIGLTSMLDKDKLAKVGAEVMRTAEAIAQVAGIGAYTP